MKTQKQKSAPAKQQKGAAPAKQKGVDCPAKYLADVTKTSQEKASAEARARAQWERACAAVALILSYPAGEAKTTLATGRGRDGWGSTDTTRCRLMHECMFNACYDYEKGAMLAAPIALSAGEIHAFTCAAQVMLKIETPDTITTLSATQSHLSSLCAKYFDGSIQQGCVRGSDKSSIASTGSGYVMRPAFARAYLAAKVARGELKGATKKQK